MNIRARVFDYFIISVLAIIGYLKGIITFDTFLIMCCIAGTCVADHIDDQKK